MSPIGDGPLGLVCTCARCSGGGWWGTVPPPPCPYAPSATYEWASTGVSTQPHRLHPDDIESIARKMADEWKQRMPLCRNPDCPYLAHLPISPCPAPPGHERE